MSFRAEGVEKFYGTRHVVRGVNVTVDCGEVVGLLGPNGAGKTTTFYLMVGLVPVSAGKIFLDELDVTKFPVYRRARTGIGYLPQEASIFRKLSVEENLFAIAETLPISTSDAKNRVAKLLDELSLSHLSKQRAMTLSGGERRRLEIARSLVLEPKFLLLDEPFSGVDPISVQEVQRIILQLRERQMGILITDHNVRETLAIVDRAYLLHEGQVLAEGSRDFLLTDPLSRKFYLGNDFKF